MKDQIRLPLSSNTIEEQEDDILLAMLIFGEARGEIKEAKIGVGSVVKNRAEHPGWWGKTLHDVILKPWQFSSFNYNDPNRGKLLFPLKHESNEIWDECYLVSNGILNREIADNTQMSDHYFDDSIKPPKWADPKKKTVKIGRLNFYRLYI